MYCIHCGVKLADSEMACPLCGTRVYHPDLPRPGGAPLYPSEQNTIPQVLPKTALVVLTTVFIIPLVITLLVDLRLHGAVTWSGFVMGALVLAYVLCVLPFWFRRPDPVVFVPCDFVAVGLYLLYINQAVDGDWFLTFAFPVVGLSGLITTAMVTLLKYVPKGALYIIGGASVLSGLLMPVMELLVNITFHKEGFFLWSLYPLAALVLLGGMLIFLAICRPVRETLERKFFL